MTSFQFLMIQAALFAIFMFVSFKAILYHAREFKHQKILMCLNSIIIPPMTCIAVWPLADASERIFYTLITLPAYVLTYFLIMNLLLKNSFSRLIDLEI